MVDVALTLCRATSPGGSVAGRTRSELQGGQRRVVGDPYPNKVSRNERFGNEPVGRGGSVMSSVIRGSGWVY